MLKTNTYKLIIIIIASFILGACNFSPVKTNSEPTLSTAPAKNSSESSDTTDTNSDTQTTRYLNNEPKHSTQTSSHAARENKHDTPNRVDAVQDTDLWKIIAANLEFERPIDRPYIQQKIHWYQNNQQYLNQVSERAAPYLYYIVSELKRNNLPLDLALLPVVESAYNAFAYSRSRASGLWQFIPTTGKGFGLKQNWWYDGRRDIVASTQAAIKYLKQLNEQFDGNWPLALAAYNAGPHSVKRAINKNAKHGKKQDYWSLSLHRETRQYVPNLIALAEVLSNPEKYRVQLKPIINKPHFSIVDIKQQIDLAVVSEMTQLNMEQLYRLNPGFNRWATAPNGPHRLLLPIDVATAFEQKLAELPQSERLAWRQHKIKKGETLSHIADLYNTNVRALKTTNRLRSNRIRAGKFLLIPTSKQPAASYTLSQESRRYDKLKRSKDGKRVIYHIKRGDNLWDISREYGVTVAQLCQWNSISQHTTLQLGQKIYIHINSPLPSNTLTQSSAAKIERGLYKIDYEVKHGDSLWLISQQFGVSVRQLKTWNNLNNGRYLQPGQSISVYTDKSPTDA